MMPRRQFSIEERQRHIDTLKVFNANVEEVVEQKEYTVHFTADDRWLELNVQLGEKFPEERPKLLITPPVQHRWVNAANGEVKGAPGLVNYSPHADLGRIVQAIIREFERFPPPPCNSQTTVVRPPMTCTTSTTSKSVSLSASITPPTTTQSNKSYSSSSNSNNSKENSPKESAKLQKNTNNDLPNLSILSIDELKEMDKDPQFFDDFVEELSVVQHLNEGLDSIIDEVANISRENESKETYLEELKCKLSNDVAALKELGEKCDLLNQKYLKKSEDYAPHHIRELLQIAVSDADTECEHHVELFLNGKIDVKTFLNSYTRAKKISFERKAKEERLGQQLTDLDRACK